MAFAVVFHGGYRSKEDLLRCVDGEEPDGLTVALEVHSQRQEPEFVLLLADAPRMLVSDVVADHRKQRERELDFLVVPGGVDGKSFDGVDGDSDLSDPDGTFDVGTVPIAEHGHGPTMGGCPQAYPQAGCRSVDGRTDESTDIGPNFRGADVTRGESSTEDVTGFDPLSDRAVRVGGYLHGLEGVHGSIMGGRLMAHPEWPATDSGRKPRGHPTNPAPPVPDREVRDEAQARCHRRASLRSAFRLRLCFCAGLVGACRCLLLLGGFVAELFVAVCLSLCLCLSLVLSLVVVLVFFVLLLFPVRVASSADASFL